MPDAVAPNIEAMQIRLVPIADLIPYARNSRRHSPEQVQAIAASIQEFGWTSPCLLDGRNGILCGHGRVLAAQLLGVRQIPCIDLSHLSETQKRAYIIADNQLPMHSGASWDLELLRLEVSELKLEGFDVSLLGFGDQLTDLLDPAVLQPDKDPDAVPPLPEVAHTKPGDLWILGAHKVYCGSATEATAWRALAGDERADIVWTDPPYNVAYEGKAGKIKNDDMSGADFYSFLRAAFDSLFGVMKPGAPIYVAHADIEGLNFRRAFTDAGFKLSGCLIWRKNSMVLGRRDYQWAHEPLLYGWKPGAKHRWYGGRKQTTVADWGSVDPVSQLPDGRWQITVGDRVLIVQGEAKIEELVPSVIFESKPRRSDKHPTMKPTALIERMLKNGARSGDIVVDAFGGSGSTLIAADRLGMCARLVEFDPRFVDVIVRRWEGYAGRRAVHAETGEPFPPDDALALPVEQS